MAKEQSKFADCVGVGVVRDKNGNPVEGTTEHDLKLEALLKIAFAPGSTDEEFQRYMDAKAGRIEI